MDINLVNSKDLILSYSLELNRKKISYSNISSRTNEFTYNFASDEVGIIDMISTESHFININRKVKVKKTTDFCLSFSLHHNLENTELLMPGLLYKNNMQGKGSYPRINDIHTSWSFDETRINIPGCIVCYNNDLIIIISHNANKIKSSTNFKNKKLTFRIPSEEWPLSYIGKDTLINTERSVNTNFINLNKDDVINEEFIIYYSKIKNKNIFSHYKKYVKKLNPQFNSKRTLTDYDYKALVLSHILSLIEKQGDYFFIKMGKCNENLQNVYEFTSASFLVKSLEAAVIFEEIDIENLKKNISKEVLDILVKSEENLFNFTYKEMSLKIANFFLQAENKNGCFKDCYDLKKKIWGGYLGIGENDSFRYGINTRTNGEAMMAYLRLCKSCDKEHKNKFMSLINNVKDFYLKVQLDNGNYGRWWTSDGKSLNSIGTNGAYIFSFFCELYKQTGDKELLKSINKAAKYYANLVNNNDFFGDTLDADCYDKEAGVILLKSFLDFYEINKNNSVLKICEICANYILTWIQMDDIKFKYNSPLGKRNFKTTGMSSVSIANQHLDNYGMLIAYEFLRLYRLNNDNFYRSIAIIMIKSCKQLISYPKDDLGKGPELYGWIPEQINHTKWDYFNNTSNTNGTFSINIAWVHILTLDYFNLIEKYFMEDIKNEI